MSKCFITKLPSSVDNDNLPVLGQLRIKMLKQDALTDNDARVIELQTNDSITVKVSGAHFTDDTLASNIGNTKIITAADGLVPLYVSNNADAVLTIDNKYSLTLLGFEHKDKNYLSKPVYFDIEDIRYCTNIKWLLISGTQVSGDISALNKMHCYIIRADNSQIYGDIKAISNDVELEDVRFDDTQVSGDISAIANLTSLRELHLNNTKVSGKIDSLSRNTNITELSGLKGLALAGDMSKIPANVKFIAQDNRKINTNFTWTAKGRQNATLLAMEGNIPFDTASMDNMLIDQATCTFNSNASKSWYNIISVSGTRTSASDAAITTIQSKGVTITGVTKVS